MPERLSSFRTPEDAERFLAQYDEIVAREWPVAHEELDVPTTFGRTRVRRSGEGPGVPLVMVHPTTGSSAGWYPVIESFCRDRVAYTPDTMGAAGRSMQTAAIHSQADLAIWLDDVLDGLGLSDVHALGYSEGGWIAGVHAAHTATPGRLRSLTLIEPSGLLGRIPARFLLRMIGGAVRVLAARDKHRAIRRLSVGMNGAGYELTDDQIELLLASMTSFRQRLPRPRRLSDDDVRRISAPSLLILGEQTRLLDPRTVATRATSLMPNVAIEVIPGAGHGVLFQQPGTVSAHVLHFLTNHDE